MKNNNFEFSLPSKLQREAKKLVKTELEKLKESNMKNTLENKARFFALYIGQNVLGSGLNNSGRLTLSNITPILEYSSNTPLSLKPISSITDEDLSYIEFNMGMIGTLFEIEIMPENYMNHWVLKYKGKTQHGYLALKDFDYLRSKGYALPYMGLSVETMIEYGWIKLSTNQAIKKD